MSNIMTRKEVAEFLKMPLRTVDYLTQTGQIPFSRLGKRSVRFDKGRLAEWFVAREGIEFRHQRREQG